MKAKYLRKQSRLGCRSVDKLVLKILYIFVSTIVDYVANNNKYNHNRDFVVLNVTKRGMVTRIHFGGARQKQSRNVEWWTHDSSLQLFVIDCSLYREFSKSHIYEFCKFLWRVQEVLKFNFHVTSLVKLNHWIQIHCVCRCSP